MEIWHCLVVVCSTCNAMVIIKILRFVPFEWNTRPKFCLLWMSSRRSAIARWLSHIFEQNSPRFTTGSRRIVSHHSTIWASPLGPSGDLNLLGAAQLKLASDAYSALRAWNDHYLSFLRRSTWKVSYTAMGLLTHLLCRQKDIVFGHLHLNRMHDSWRVRPHSSDSRLIGLGC